MTIAKEITSYDQLIEVCNARVDELQLTRAQLDELASLPENYSSKVLRKKHYKYLGQCSYPKILFALGLRVFLLEDPVATAKTLAVRTPRKANYDTSAMRKPKLLTAPADSAGASLPLSAAAQNV